MGAIMAGLNNATVQTLINWKKIGESNKKAYEKLQNFLDPAHNFFNYRKLMVEIERAKKPFLPYVAIHLRDILLLLEVFGNNPEEYSMNTKSIENGKKIFCALTSQKSVYNLEKNQEIYEYLLNVKHFNSEQLLQIQSMKKEDKEFFRVENLKSSSRPRNAFAFLSFEEITNSSSSDSIMSPPSSIKIEDSNNENEKNQVSRESFSFSLPR